LYRRLKEKALVDFGGELGARARERLTTELVIWPTTVAPSGTPQPRPVWFLWDGSVFLIYSESRAKKLEHIARNPQVALHFNSTPDGDDVQVFLATATIDRNPPLAQDVEAYLAKYRADIEASGMTPETFSATYNVLLQVVPTKLRGM
jgi:PPOX class probable F420-dependent enzyme